MSHKILILGASSFIGRHFYQKYASSGCIGSHFSHQLDGTVRFDPEKDRIKNLVKDCSISHALILFAESNIDACVIDEDRSRKLNVLFIKNVVDQLIDLNIKPIFTSSEYVFDGEKGGYTEEDTPNPKSLYGNQKIEVENYILEKCENFVILRLAKVFSTHPNCKSLLVDWVRKLRGGEKIRCATDQYFSPIHVDDVVAWVTEGINQDINGIYHIAGKETFSRYEILQVLLRHVEHSLNDKPDIEKCLLKDIPFLDFHPKNLSLSPSKIISTTGLLPKNVETCCKELAYKCVDLPCC